jgi:biotin carboxyl carrier protein
VILEVAITNADGATRVYSVRLSRNGNGFTCSVDGREVSPDISAPQPDVLSIIANGQSYEVLKDRDQIRVNGQLFAVEVRDPRSLRARRRLADSADGPRKVTAPMPGKVVRILHSEGTSVEAGQGIIVIEAMKMQNEMKAPKAGVIKKINVTDGAAVNAGDTLAIVE